MNELKDWSQVKSQAGFDGNAVFNCNVWIF